MNKITDFCFEWFRSIVILYVAKNKKWNFGIFWAEKEHVVERVKVVPRICRMKAWVHFAVNWSTVFFRKWVNCMWVFKSQHCSAESAELWKTESGFSAQDEFNGDRKKIRRMGRCFSVCFWTKMRHRTNSLEIGSAETNATSITLAGFFLLCFIHRIWWTCSIKHCELF